MKRVLIISPHFPPVNAPDMQRARIALSHLRGYGWEPTVLAVVPDHVEGAVIEPLLEKSYPDDIRVIRVAGIPPGTTRRFGFGSLWWRCGSALRRAGDALLAAERFDLVFFTTTQFDAFTLGPRWLARYRVPYVLDYQDPWVNDYYRRTGTRPPGGPLKFWLSQFTARRREPEVVRKAAAIVSVSSAYAPDLLARYPDLDASRLHHLPFGTEPADLETARRHPPARSLVPFGDGQRHFVYAGRCGPDMQASLTLLFRAFRRFLDASPEPAGRIRMHFIGTGYAPPPLGRDWVTQIARDEGVGDYVFEHRYRVPYFEALHYLGHADALLMVGSSDPTYSASKIFPYLFARRPLLAIAHEHSLMLQLARDQGIATAYGFTNRWSETAEGEAIVARIHSEWFAGAGSTSLPAAPGALLREHTAAAMTQRLATIFARATSSDVSLG